MTGTAAGKQPNENSDEEGVGQISRQAIARLSNWKTQQHGISANLSGFHPNLDADQAGNPFPQRQYQALCRYEPPKPNRFQLPTPEAVHAATPQRVDGMQCGEPQKSREKLPHSLTGFEEVVAAWLKHENCLEIIKKAWIEGHTGSRQLRLCKKLMHTKKELIAWNKREVNCVQNNIQSLRDQIGEGQKTPSDDNTRKEQEMQAQLNHCSKIGDFARQIKGGSLRASSTFPGDRHLIDVWSPSSSNKDGTRIYYEDITFRDLLLDSSLRGGGIYIVDSARIRINNCFFIHFTTQGILVYNGHETFISSLFLGQHLTVGGDRDDKYFSGTAIELASNDNSITDVAIFSAATGIVLRGQANMVTGVHCYKKATYFGGVGILVKLPSNSQTRINNCYMDYTAIVLEDPVQVQISNGFFLGDANVLLRSVQGRISGLNIVENMFSGDASRMKPIVKLEGEFTNIDQVVIDRNNVDGMSLKSTVGKLTMAGKRDLMGCRFFAPFAIS
ncbi:hypothetical protein GIB67_015848 [Kingdonia uniflora]|uniref:Pectin lyase-like superfamily protein n=1 Tax=Kingdonia uniflora TaxID=39325 RepID=A0A7J7NEC1_9MAGN|nr:hypothetical protein GIB67_015848 [Kingdonia uniflora]